MKQTLDILNELEQSGVIKRYAIGGAVAAVFYMEPVATEDLDVFVLLPADHTGLISLEPVYDALLKRGCRTDREHIVVAGVPVQFLPAYNDLVDEALQRARDVEYEGVPTRVLTAEHLAAIMLETGREKDRQRFNVFRNHVELDENVLIDIIERHGLKDRWTKWTSPISPR